MNILVYGAGSLGLLFAKYLSENYKVDVIAKQERKKAIENSGLNFIKNSNKETVNLNVYENIKEINNPPDFIILSVKSFDIDNSFYDISNIFQDKYIITIQNGVYAEDIAKKFFSKKYILPAYVMIGSKTINNNTIEEFLNKGMKIGYLDKQSKHKAEQFNTLLNNSSISSSVVHDIMRQKWHKMMFYCAGASLNSLTGIKDLENKNINWISKKILEEIVRVASCLNLGFDLYALEQDVQEFLINFKPNQWNASVGEDLKKGKKTEIDYLNGYITTLATKYNIETPFNKLITSLIKTIEQTKYFASL